MDKYPQYSGMSFLPHETDYVIEESPAYTNIGGHVKTVEFVRNIDTKLWFFEAKFNKDFVGKFNERKREVYEKFLHSLSLYCAVRLGVMIDKLPNSPELKGIVFALIINDCGPGDCRKIQEVLKTMLNPYLKIWKAEISVFNNNAAKQNHLIS
ncbi:MAG: hypothetical protein LBJ36_11155 [Synergistaceae bacterium]|jgi:hypothetical protein|nr:hypothetical protein [Synergistaceae bacterium]